MNFTRFDQKLMELRRSGQITFKVAWIYEMEKFPRVHYTVNGLKLFTDLLRKHFHCEETFLGCYMFFLDKWAVNAEFCRTGRRSITVYCDGTYDEELFPISMIDLIKPILDHRKLQGAKNANAV